MKLSSKLLKNVDGLNSFDQASSWSISQDCDAGIGEDKDLYFMIVDLDRGSDNACPPRFMPVGTVVTLEAAFNNAAGSDPIVVAATQPFAEDKSIWKVALTSSMLPANGIVKFALTIDAKTYRWSALAAIGVDNNGSCC